VSPLAALSVKERAAGLAALRAVAALPGRDRLLLTMKFIEGLDYAQIAEVLHLQRTASASCCTGRRRAREGVPHLERWVDPTP
jgi:DNA-directed RNA polymerase specialized sigma24 family protein